MPWYWLDDMELESRENSLSVVYGTKRADINSNQILRTMTLPQFIITMDGHLRIGMVNQHKDLLKPGDQCIGGGYYHFDFISNRILLDRASYDFGKPKWHLLEVLKVPSTYRGMRIIYQYDDNYHDDFIVSEELNIAPQ